MFSFMEWVNYHHLLYFWLVKGVEEQYSLQTIGEVPEVRERLYAVTVERRIKHPAVVAICETAKSLVFRDTQTLETPATRTPRRRS